ncbi:hypothetical protein ISF_08372 [Cordyceps fumosorosea ARSEF 2679]|uniref:RNase MRP protein 1 RNA binding domain-containing protein n=1 Tax=Cordyceps fumosorosea (strain ARSEF 2679) TaxID=1081104 RepID=A0A167MJV6_CORFA|nr:hypothetical protein ISF_08372 [Cordyceps fumosorosea ARSEF 2679]OAA54444.1 hypothetical protein ISF_08372 [Cordyceps fumosorosea ARSEF 2679]
MDHGDGTAAADDVALTTLATSLLPILEAFHRRHRNQHGASHWWSSFQLVRRGARSLAADLRDSPPTAAAAGKSQPKRTKTTEKRVRLRRQRRRQFLARAALLRDHTVPKAYLCFSQLIADNQHATLGLLLLSVLASLSSILTSISPPPPPPPQEAPDYTTHTTGSADDSSTPCLRAAAGQKKNIDADRGVAVSRESVPARAAASSSSKQPSKTSSLDTYAVAPTNRGKKCRALGGGSDGADAEPNKKKTKKSKKKAGDELSSLFGSL